MTSPRTERLDLLPEIVWEGDAAGRLLWWNAAGQAYAGRSERDAEAGEGWLTFAHLDDREALRAERLKALRTGERYEFTCRLRRHDGVFRWHRVRGVPARDAAGALTGWVGTCVDIHDLHVADEKVTVARALLREAPLGFGFVDTDLRFRYLTPRLAAVNGLSVGEHIGRTVAEVLPDLWPQLEPIYRQVLREEHPVRDVEVTGTTPANPDDQRTWFVDYFPVQRGAAVAGVGLVVRDVTERLTRTRELERRNRMLTRAERIAGIGTFEHDLVRGEGWATPGLYELLGFDADTSLGPDGFRALVRPDERDQVEATFAQLLMSPDPVQQRYHLVDDDGPERLLELHASTERDEQGHPVKLVGTYQDVTARVAAEEERVELLERSISAADTERRRIAEHLHDRAIQALTAGLFRLEHAQEVDSTEHLEPVREAVRRAIEDLRLTILELIPADTPAAELEDAIATYIQHTIRDRPVETELVVTIPDPAAVPDAVAAAANRIVQEAISNVRRHADAQHLRVRLEIRDRTLFGSVRDDGRGLHGPAAPGHVGLRLMRERAAAAGGLVMIDAGPDGHGTEVRFELPL